MSTEENATAQGASGAAAANGFSGLGLRNSVLKGVTEAGFETPTEIQARMIPAVLTGKDVIGQAKTGTGKTASFALPILHMSDKNKPMQALVLVPTRELAAQVASEINELGQFTPIRATCIIGGESMRQQVASVKRGGHILVGTPGRVMDLHGRHQIHFDNVAFVVLDEVDRMLDIGFREDIRKILGIIRHDHQTLFVSATISPDIETLARRYMREGKTERITSISGSLTVERVEQKHLPVPPWAKRSLLLHLLTHEKPDTTVVFCRTKATVHKVTEFLRRKGLDCLEIHGDLQQKKRNDVMDSLRAGKLDVLVASDLAARGLDVEHISHVINYDLPEDPEIYIHRIGRTARAGRAGIAWSFVTPDEGTLLTEIEKLTGVEITKLEYPDFVPGPPPEGFEPRKPIERKDPIEKLTERTAAAVTVGDYSPEELAVMFPDGNIPKQLPPRTLGSRFRTKRR